MHPVTKHIRVLVILDTVQEFICYLLLNYKRDWALYLLLY